jgi:cellobiose phosphorylase
MRGTRDAAQDFTAIVPLDPGAARARLLELFGMMRSDGWFPRQYSLEGRGGPHDLRAFMDSGWWVWELLYEYLVHTREFEILAKPATFLDTGAMSSILEHVCTMMRFALAEENQGEHGLLKIREGDWNDSVNGAGVLERGETVMASAQAVLALRQSADLLRYVTETGVVSTAELRDPSDLADTFDAGAEAMATSLVKHARNAAGYFNGVFNDAGAWCFSPKDPDGRRRINTPANAFAVIAGLVKGRERERVFDALQEVRTDAGWLVFGPAISWPPIANLGRIGSGDLPAGMCENGAPYNHGCHGFLGRACWVAGKGAMLHETLRYLLPYDQEAHPTGTAKAAPYAVPNYWRNVPGSAGEAGATFLSGSISTGLRNIWHGLVGFRPDFGGLVVDPCIPPGWDTLTASSPYLGKQVEVRIENPDGRQCGVRYVELDGERIHPNARFCEADRDVVRIPWERFATAPDRSIQLRLLL